MKSSYRKQQILNAKYLDALSKGARPSTHHNSEVLRERSTETEKILWLKLRNRQLKGKKFRRQHPLSKYVLDFYCHECKLDVELDRYHHKQVDQIENDTERTELLKEFGITVIRIMNDEVIDETEKVLEKIAEYLV